MSALTDRDKYAIKGMLHDGMDFDQIRVLMPGKKHAEIKEVIDAHLKDNPQEIADSAHRQAVIEDVRRRFNDANIQSPKTGLAITKALKVLASQDEVLDSEKLFAEALKHLGGTDMLAKVGGATAMTHGLSEYADKTMEMVKPNRKFGENLFNPLQQ